jgi:hypothetical protein
MIDVVVKLPAGTVPPVLPEDAAPPVVTVTGVTLVFQEGLGEADLQAHVDADEPHPAYDDIQSLTLTLENGLV